jgi:hypothetical protein
MQPMNDWRWPFFTVDFELTNYCSQNCAFCPRHAITRPKGFINLKLADHIITQLSKINSRVTFCGMGNPLLHQQFVEISGLCRDKRMNFGLTIQSPALIETNQKKIFEAAPGFIEISFPTIDKNLFLQLYPGENFSKNLDQLKVFLQKRGSARGVTIIAIETDLEKVSCQDTINFWQSLGVNCRIQVCHSRGGNLTDLTLTKKKSALKIADKADRIFNCGLFAAHSFIDWQGKLLACCHDLSGSTEISDLAIDTIEEAGKKKLKLLKSPLPFKICENCDEPAALRPLPERNYPNSASARKRYMKSAFRN